MAAEINDFDTLTIPYLLVPYKSPEPNQGTEIVRSFHRQLADAAAAGHAGAAPIDRGKGTGTGGLRRQRRR